MYLVAIAWLYVAVMMAIAEATHSQGTLLGALITFLLYGVLPLSVVLYVMGAPLRRRQRLQQDLQPSQDDHPDAVPKPHADPVKNR